MKKILFCCVAFFALLASSAHGDVAHIDFGGDDLNTVSTPGLAFNNVNAFGLTTDLVFETGATSTIDFDYSQITGAGNPATTAVAGNGADYGGPYPAALVAAGIPTTALQDSAFIFESNTATFLLSDLNASATYDLLFYGARGNNGIMDNTFTVTDGTGVLPTQAYAPFNNATDTVNFTGLIADANGEITVTVSVGAGNTDFRGAVNYGRITETLTVIPEPSSLALLSIGAVTLASRRRRK